MSNQYSKNLPVSNSQLANNLLLMLKQHENFPITTKETRNCRSQWIDYGHVQFFPFHWKHRLFQSFHICQKGQDYV